MVQLYVEQKADTVHDLFVCKKWYESLATNPNIGWFQSLGSSYTIDNLVGSTLHWTPTRWQLIRNYYQTSLHHTTDTPHLYPSPQMDTTATGISISQALQEWHALSLVDG